MGWTIDLQRRNRLTSRRLLLGPPGTGKTTRLLAEMERRLARGVPPARVAFVSFTRAAVREARGRACAKFGLTDDDLPYFRTLHSLCFHQLGLRRGDVFGREALAHLGELTDEELTGKFELDAPTLGERGDALLFLDQYARSTLTPLADAWRAHGAPLDWWRLTRFTDAYAALRADLNLADFTDMLEDYAATGAPVDVDLVLIDEAQDLNALQWLCVDKAFSEVQEMIICGDDDQCQPGDAMVHTTDGLKSMAFLDESSDKLVCYDRPSASICGLRNGYGFTKSKRLYTGILYKFTTESGKRSSYTDNHLCFVRWKKSAREKTSFVTYIMKRGDWFRVGQCQLFRSDGCLHLTARANNEKADGVWIVGLFETRTEAYVYEQIIAATYNLPMLTFEPIHGVDGLQVSRDTIATVFSTVDSSFGGRKALAAHGLLIDAPFVNRLTENYSRYGNVINVVAACNVLPGLMELPVCCGNKTISWEPFTLRKERVVDLPVYGLNVEKYHTYISDGIITHNCIYHWAGASADALLAFDGEREVLSRSYRLPLAVWTVAAGVAGRIGRRYAKAFSPDLGADGAARAGLVEWLARPDEVDLSAGTWLLLARTRRQLTELVEVARGQGVVYVLHGRSSVDPDHVTQIREYEEFRAGDPAVPLWHDALVAIPLDDREYLLACLRRGESLTRPPRVRIETIHGAKGLEADRVLLLTDLNERVRRGAELDPDAEQRVLYVAVTRAREALYLVVPQKSAYGYQI